MDSFCRQFVKSGMQSLNKTEEKKTVSWGGRQFYSTLEDNLPPLSGYWFPYKYVLSEGFVSNTFSYFHVFFCLYNNSGPTSPDEIFFMTIESLER